MRCFLSTMVVLALFACDRDKAMVPQQSPLPPGPSEDGKVPPVESSDGQGPEATISQGAKIVFGLRIPDRMNPGSAPPKVYSFDGPYSLDQMVNYVSEQVVAEKTVEEDESSHLFRNVRVKSPAGKATGDERLAIRIYQGQARGATVDIWLEEDWIDGKLPDRRSTSATRSPTFSKHKGKNVTTSKERAQRAKQRENDYRLLYKYANGELTEEERRNPVFD